MSGNQPDSANSDSHERPAELRRRATEALPQIAEQANEALRQVGIEFDVFFIVPRSGNAILTFGTLADPTDEVWEAASNIINVIVQDAIDAGELRSHELSCAGPTVADGRLAPVHGLGTA
jgi:hypothetical protein